MKLKKILLTNFKGYEKAEIDFNELTLIVGKNDSGKSTILQALNIFFNQDSVLKNIKKEDLIRKGASEMSIKCHFSVEEEEEEVKLGSEKNKTTIKETNLLNKDGDFVLGYNFDGESLKKTTKPFFYKSYIICDNYDISKTELGDKKSLKGKKILEQLTQKELQEIVEGLDCGDIDKKVNQQLRECIIKNKLSKLETKEIEVSFTEKNDELYSSRLKNIIDNNLPKFTIFSNEQANSLSDKENSKPIEDEIKKTIKEKMQTEFESINEKMKESMEEKIEEMQNTYSELFSSFLEDDEFKLKGVPKIDFKTEGIKDKQGLDLDSRGSGFRRLALLSLHLSKYSNNDEQKNNIFALEEPETSQNPHNQKGIIKAIEIMQSKGASFIITTHSPNFAKAMDECDNLNYIVIKKENDVSEIKKDGDSKDKFKEIIKILGILPLDTHGKKLIVYVEGKHDVQFFNKYIELCGSRKDILFVPVGGVNNISGYINLDVYKDLNLKYAAIIDKEDKANKGKSIKEALEEMGYKDNYIELKEGDITDYITININENDEQGTKKPTKKAKIKQFLELDKNKVENNIAEKHKEELKEIFIKLENIISNKQ